MELYEKRSKPVKLNQIKLSTLLRHIHQLLITLSGTWGVGKTISRERGESNGKRKINWKGKDGRSL